MCPETRYRNRETGAIETERVFKEKTLHFLYENPFGRFLNGLLLKRRVFSLLYGGWQRRRGKGRIQDFVDSIGVNVAEAEKPLEAYPTLDEFFTRRLAPDARPIDADPEHLVSPADGRVPVCPRLDGGILTVKSSRATLEDLLGEADLAERYRGGAAVIVRLAPVDYHRFHFPEAGVAKEARRTAGSLHSVHPIALAAGAPSFLNERTITGISTKGFGEIQMIEIGAIAVGKIVQTYTPGPVERGQEKGFFRFGASTVVLLAEPGRLRLDEDLAEANANGLESLVRVGMRIGCRA
jgi:phosphatidylserine decarboxylase